MERATALVTTEFPEAVTGLCLGERGVDNESFDITIHFDWAVHLLARRRQDTGVD